MDCKSVVMRNIRFRQKMIYNPDASLIYTLFAKVAASQKLDTGTQLEIKFTYIYCVVLLADT